jgi:hypothetical protein
MSSLTHNIGRRQQHGSRKSHQQHYNSESRNMEFIMKLQHRSSAITRILTGVVTIVLVLATYLICSAEPSSPTIEWQLFDTKVVSWGKPGTTTEGKVRTGVKIKGKAITETAGAIFHEGTFSIEMTLFSPSRNQNSQKKGNWYARGAWIITAKDADPAALTSRYNPYVLSGALNATLSYDPSVKTGPMEAVVQFQRGGTRPRVGRPVQNSFIGNSIFEGKLTTPFIPAPPPQQKENRE